MTRDPILPRTPPAFRRTLESALHNLILITTIAVMVVCGFLIVRIVLESLP